VKTYIRGIFSRKRRKIERVFVFFTGIIITNIITITRLKLKQENELCICQPYFQKTNASGFEKTTGKIFVLFYHGIFEKEREI